MPYGSFVSGACGYECAVCRNVICWSEWRPYCQNCGRKQPDELHAQAIGLAVYPPMHGKRSTSDMEKINAELEAAAGSNARFWDYSISHCEMQFHIVDQVDADCALMRPHLLLLCSGVTRLEVRTSFWKSRLQIVRLPPEADAKYEVADIEANVSVHCHLVRLYFDVEGF